MSLEFAIEYPCALRARYKEEHLRAWGRLGSLHTRLTTGEASAPTDEKVRFVERAAGFERNDSPEDKLNKLETLLARGT